MSPQDRERLVSVAADKVAAGLPPEQRDLFMRADLGMQIEAFLDTPVGQYLSHIRDIERADAVEDLIKAMGADDHAAARRHHQRIALCDQFVNWLTDAMAVGQEAEQTLKRQESTD